MYTCEPAGELKLAWPGSHTYFPGLVLAGLHSQITEDSDKMENVCIRLLQRHLVDSNRTADYCQGPMNASKSRIARKC